MLRLSVSLDKGSKLHVLFLGAHSDDIEIGCGGTILELIRLYPEAKFTWIVFGADGDRAEEARLSAENILTNASDKEIIVMGFRDGFFPYQGSEIKEFFEALKKNCSPDLIFTHYRLDLHQDHRLINELTWNTYRDHLILEYEIPKYDGDLGKPNLFVPLGKTVCARKISHIFEHFDTQKERHWFTEDTFWALLRLRGVECGSATRYAEAFYSRKAVIFTPEQM